MALGLLPVLPGLTCGPPNVFEEKPLEIAGVICFAGQMPFLTPNQCQKIEYR